MTPLAGFATGMGRATRGMRDALAARTRAIELLPYAIGVSPGPTGGALPAGTRRIALPTRALVRVWARSDRVSMDWWLPPGDVVHATNYTVGPTRSPTLLTVQDIGFAVDPSTTDPVTAHFAGMLRRAIARGAHLHVTTEHLAAQVEAYFGPGLGEAGRLVVVPLGVPSLTAPGSLPDRLAGALAGRPYVLALGDQVARKNLPFLVEAFGRAADVLGDLCLVLAGPEGSATPAVRAAREALRPATRDRVLLAGAVDEGARVSLLTGASVLAYPSLYEGFGLPPLEAMTVGVPALVSTGGALREVAAPGAEMVDPADLDGWAAGLHRLVTDDRRRHELIDAGRVHAARYTWDATAEGLLAAYRRLAAAS